MAESWIPLPLDKGLMANVDEDAVAGGFATAIENGFVNEFGGHSRFPGLADFATLAGVNPTYLHDFDNDLIGVTSGRVYRMDRAGTVTDVTDVPVAGGRRVTFAKTGTELLMAAGGEIVRLRNARTELLSSSAPLASHVAWIDGFTIAIEVNSQRFFHSGAGTPDQWDPLDTFAADTRPDNVISVVVTPFAELMLGGPDSIEQFERNTSGDPPFARRWSIGTGVKIPYGMVAADNTVFVLNAMSELTRANGQSAVPVSDLVGKLLEEIDNWDDAWIGGHPDKPLHTVGQRFIILQAPNATNAYGTKGVTLAYDRRNQRFSTLHGWDSDASAPGRWPGWSHWPLWGNVYVGGAGRIYRLTNSTYLNGSEIQRWLVRTGHIAIGKGDGFNMTGFRLRIKRGLGGSPTPTIEVRCARDGGTFSSPITRSLGEAGDGMQFIDFGAMGAASTFRFEFSSTANCSIDLIGADYKGAAVGH